MKTLKVKPHYHDENPETLEIRPESELPAEISDAIYKQARGPYQRELLEGFHSWSGSSLKGRASSYGAHYAASRDSLMRRINAALDPLGAYTDVPLVLCDVGANGSGAASIANWLTAAFWAGAPPGTGGPSWERAARASRSTARSGATARNPGR